MKCPFCQKTETRVLDSRVTPDHSSIRRRRSCGECDKRFTTYERVEQTEITIVKRDGRREAFSREKALKGILNAVGKRPVKREKIDAIVNNVEASLRDLGKDEIKSHKVGKLIMAALADIDDVAYLRFASVYKKFRRANQFVEAIQTLKKMEVEQ